jgi:hypothetical protein
MASLVVDEKKDFTISIKLKAYNLILIQNSHNSDLAFIYIDNINKMKINVYDVSID